MPGYAPPGLLERILRAAGYACLGISGILILSEAPSSISNALGRTLTIVWALFMLTALPAGLAAFLGRYRGEYMALPWFIGGLFVAVLHLWAKAILINPDLSARGLFLTALLLAYGARYVTLHRLVRTTTKGG